MYPSNMSLSIKKIHNVVQCPENQYIMEGVDTRPEYRKGGRGYNPFYLRSSSQFGSTQISLVREGDNANGKSNELFQHDLYVSRIPRRFLL